MGRKIAQKLAWGLARRQHWVVTRRQLLDLGFTRDEIGNRIRDGRLHPVHAGVYAVGRPTLTREGYFIAAVLACGLDAVLSHDSAAELWEIRPRHRGPIHVSVPLARTPRRPGIKVHRRVNTDATKCEGIPVTSPIDTIVDLATRLSEAQLERAVNEAANRDLTDPEALREALHTMPYRPGARVLARLLDKRTYQVTDSRLEQQFLRLARAAGLPKPQTQVYPGESRVDFYWRELGLIVEADSLRYHRTPAQQAADRLRDQRHAAAGLTSLRFTHWQIFHEPDHVTAILTAVAGRLAGQRVVPVRSAAQ
jgi:very-short-patch-repair endonuclease